MGKEIILRPKEDTTCTFSIRIDIELAAKFDELSQRSGYSRNQLIALAMQEYIDNVKLVAEPENKYVTKKSKKDQK